MEAGPAEEQGRSLVEVVAAWRVALVGSLAVVASAAQGFRSTGDWPIFTRAAYLLYGRRARWLPLPGGLHMFANYPELQIGPLSAVVAGPFVAMGDAGRPVAGAFLMAIGLAAWVWLDRLAAAGIGTPATVAGPADAGPGADAGALHPLTSPVVGLAVVLCWLPLANGYLHIDDGLAMLACVAAIAAVRADRAVVAGVLLGAAVGSKPWAVLFAPMLLGLTWHRPRAVAGFAAAAAACWAPFVIAEPSTLTAAKPTVDIAASSVLHLLGVPLGLAPEWVRAPQLAAGLVVGAVVASRGRWLAVPLVAIAVRLLLDPGVFSYYTSGLVLAAAAWDLLGARTAVPWATLTAAVAVGGLAVGLDPGPAAAVVRLVACLALIGLGLAGPWHARPRAVASPAVA